jgi:GMP synthase (glutamine-hydrolysing)
MILIVNICNNLLHYQEFVRPIEDIIRNTEEPFITRHYTELTSKDVYDSHRIIITGTSLQDFEYSKHLDKFKFISDELLKNDSSKKPILGICGGMQILCLMRGCKLVKGLEIGLVKAKFSAEFLGMNGEKDVYSLHNMVVKKDNALEKHFHIYASTKYVQAVKDKHYKIYGVLFHPEVRNKDIIRRFLCV